MPHDFDRPDDQMKGPPVPGSRPDDSFDRPEDDGPDGGIPEPVNAASHVPTRTGRRHPCPSCGSRSIAAIRYGYPPAGAFEDPGLAAGEFTLGGCCIFPEMPEFHCNACNHEWRGRPPESGPLGVPEEP